MLYNDKNIKTLEFDKIREMLADCAATAGAKESALTLAPSQQTEISHSSPHKSREIFSQLCSVFAATRTLSILPLLLA